jgi:hypothetical protein
LKRQETRRRLVSCRRQLWHPQILHTATSLRLPCGKVADNLIALRRTRYDIDLLHGPPVEGV